MITEEALERATDAIWRCNTLDRMTAESYARAALKEAGTNWNPISEIPEEIKDRQKRVLLWVPPYGPTTGHWDHYVDRGWRWNCHSVLNKEAQPTHFAIVTEPETCAHCLNAPVVNLDGDNLCKEHADAWCRGEGQSQQDNYSNTTGEVE